MRCNVLRRLWDRLARLWRPLPCEVCGAPSVGFVADLTGRLPTKDAAGKPITRMYVSGAKRACRRCMDEAVPGR